MTVTTGSPAVPPRPFNRVLIGIFFMCGATSLFPVMNGLVKLLGDTYSSEQLVWARTLSHLIFVLALFGPARGVGIFRTRQPIAQFLRSCLLLASTTMFFFAVHFVPLAEAAAIGFVAPFIVSLLAVPILGEKLSLPRVVAILFGFAGVLVVIRPGSDVFQWQAIFILGSASCYALYQVITRRVAGSDAPETSVVYSALVGAAIMSMVVPFRWQATPTELRDIVLLSSLGVLGGLGHYCVARALTYAAANVIAPFNYFQMIGSVVVGWILFHHLPDMATWAGTILIIGSGLYIGWRETRERRKR